MALRLVDRFPEVASASLVEAMAPPPRFAAARFSNYQPDPDEPSQRQAVSLLEEYADRIAPPARRLLRRARPPGPSGVYLDGGFGVGKTHLLAALWHASPEPKAYGTFVELTHLVGALGFAGTVAALSGHRLLAIDEFELDDPGDTVLVSTLLTRLADAGVHLAATSNTLPGALGEGRFAAQDFLREIQGLAGRFTPLRIDGQDFRHRGLPEPPEPHSAREVQARAGLDGASCDGFGALLAHLAELHPSRYGALLDSLSLVCLEDVRPVEDQGAALRLVVFIDRLYDRALPVVFSGSPLSELFPPELLSGGYRKKYLRALSRWGALAREARGPAAGAPAT